MEIGFIYEWLTGLGYDHPIHPPLTYVPMGLTIGGLTFALLSLLPGFDKYARTARHCITLAFLGIFPTVILGYMDWQHYHGGNWMYSIKMKILLAGILTVFLAGALLLHQKHSARSLPQILLYFLSFSAVVLLGYYGGEIVFGAAHTLAGEHAHGKTAQAPAGTPDFTAVAHIFENRCVSCHSGDDPPEGLKLTAHREVMEGATGEKVVIPGKPAESELVRRIKGIAEPRMPLNQAPLTDTQIRTIEKWIAAGAPGPETPG